MNNNQSIGCTVKDCEYHDQSDYCGLKHIEVAAGSTPEVKEEASMCASYKKENM